MTTPRRAPNKPPAVPPADLAAIRRAVTARREKAGLTRDALSAAAGLSPAAVANIEAGHAAPALGTLYAIARALGCRVADLAPGPETGQL